MLSSWARRETFGWEGAHHAAPSSSRCLHEETWSYDACHRILRSMRIIFLIASPP